MVDAQVLREVGVDQPLFLPGQVEATPAAMEAMVRHGVHPMKLLARHVTGDWGEALCDEDKERNRQAVRRGKRVLSAYYLDPVQQVQVWMTTAGDRSSTIFVLPEEY